MNVGIVDTTVVVHLYRQDPAARNWLASQAVKPFVTPITWLEVMQGAQSKKSQVDSLAALSGFTMLYQTTDDMNWAMAQMQRLRPSNSVGMMDCLIAAPAHRLQVPLYTHNVRHMTVLLGAALVVKPY